MLLDAKGKQVVIPKGTLLDESWVARFEELSVDEILVRTPITCDTRYGVCSTVLWPRFSAWALD